MKKLVLTIAIALSMAVNSNAIFDGASSVVSGALNTGKLSSTLTDSISKYVGSKVDISSIVDKLPGNMSNYLGNITSDAFGGVTNTIFKGLNTISFGALEKCYEIEDSTTDFNVCSFADGIDEFLKGDYCNLLPDVSGMTKKSQNFNYSGVRKWCDELTENSRSAVSDKVNTLLCTDKNKTFDECYGEKAGAECSLTKRAVQNQFDAFVENPNSETYKNSLISKYFRQGNNTMVEDIKRYFVGHCDVVKEKNLANVTIEHLTTDKGTKDTASLKNRGFAVARTMEEAEKSLLKTVESYDAKRSGNPTRVASAVASSASSKVDDLIKNGDISTNDASTWQKKAQEIMNGTTIKDGKTEINQNKSFAEFFELAKDNEMKEVVAELRNSPNWYAFPTEAFVNQYREDVRPQIIQTIRQQEATMAKRMSEINEKWENKKELALKLIEKDMYMQVTFQRADAEKEICNEMATAIGSTADKVCDL